MAYQRTQQAAAPANDAWKALGFINLSLPGKSGKARKLGAIPLRGSVSSEKELNDWLAADPARVAHILSQLVVEYRSAEPAEGSGFALPATNPV